MTRKYIVALIALILVCVSTVALAGSPDFPCPNPECNTFRGWDYKYHENDQHKPFCLNCAEFAASVPCSYIEYGLSLHEDQTCENCGHERKGTHFFTTYIPDRNATCLADGTKTATCDYDQCSVTDTVTDEGSALGHSFTTYVSDNNATCLADGTKTARCVRSLLQFMYPEGIIQENFRNGYAQIRALWQPIDASEAKLVKININIKKTNANNN